METTTKRTVSYWDENAKYSSDLKRLTDLHMPDSGEAATVEGELIRIANRLVYEHCNNGNCNLVNVEYGEEEYLIGYDDEGEEEYDYEETVESTEIDQFYQDMLDLVVETIKPSNPEIEQHVLTLIDMVNQIAYCELGYGFGQDEMDVYNNIVDSIMEYVLPRENNFVPFNGY